MQTGEIISRVQSLYSKGVESDDTRLSARHIYNKLVTVREQVAIDQLRQGLSWAEWDQQPLHAVPMKNFEGQWCPMMKSIDTIPSAIGDGTNEGVIVSSPDGSRIYSRTSFEHQKYLKGNKYTSKRVHYFVHDDYLYLLNSRMKKSFMHAMWRDPIKVYRLDKKYKGLSTCFSNRTVPFFTPGDVIELTIQIASQELVQQFNQVVEDVSDNTTDTPVGGGK
jgi:hypothetical protein